MILIVTNREDQTADFLILELKIRGAKFLRFNTEDFPTNVSLNWEIRDGHIDGYFVFPKKRIDFGEIKSIWYRRPVLPVPHSEITDPETQNFVIQESQSALDGVWRTLPSFWVSDPDKIRVAEKKLYQLKLASEIGFRVWPTLVTSNSNSAYAFYEDYEGDVIYKPLRKGRLLRRQKQSLIFTNLIDNKTVSEFDRVKYAPCLFQKYIHKKSELRVTVIGSKVFTVEIESQNTLDAIHDWRRSQVNLHHKIFELPPIIEDQCKQLVKSLGLEFGAIDLIMSPDNEYIFVEINPNGQWAWIQQLCPEMPMRETLAELLINGGKYNE